MADTVINRVFMFKTLTTMCGFVSSFHHVFIPGNCSSLENIGCRFWFSGFSREWSKQELDDNDKERQVLKIAHLVQF